ncbi:pyridoxal-phosphate dependent enzyme [Rhizorhabdus histidinilytica]
MSPASLAEARDRIAGCAIRTPLIRLETDGGGPIFLKLENLQPIGSFKIRCAANALIARRDRLRGGVSTASAGNFAQGLAYAGRALGVPVTTYVPTTAAQSKIAGLQRLGATVLPVPYDRWWAMLDTPTDDPSFIHPVTDPDVLVGNGTIALEILEELPEVARVIAPYGGGGLSVGIAAALRASGSQARTFACETEAGAPLVRRSPPARSSRCRSIGQLRDGDGRPQAAAADVAPGPDATGRLDRGLVRADCRGDRAAGRPPPCRRRGRRRCAGGGGPGGTP